MIINFEAIMKLNHKIIIGWYMLVIVFSRLATFAITLSIFFVHLAKLV